MSDRTLRLVIAGRVQGVGYRDFVQSRAQVLGVTGWVRNWRDGTVEAVVSGPPESLDELLAACWRGPPAARVADIQIEPVAAADAELPAAGLAIRPTP